jgi:hypothetical protein
MLYTGQYAFRVTCMSIRQEQQNVGREHLGSDPYRREYCRRVGRDLQRPKAYNFSNLAPKKKAPPHLLSKTVREIPQQRLATFSNGNTQCTLMMRGYVP